MRLYLDIGNTRLKWALDLSGELVEAGSVDYRDDGLSELAVLSNFEIEFVWASSVASSEVCDSVERWVFDSFGLSVNWASVNEQECGVSNRYKGLSQLGVDRWMAVLGARAYVLDNNVSSRSVVVLDAGTAVTVDVIDSSACFKGGVILPGLKMMHDSLVGRTAGIESSLSDCVAVLGRSTKECVSSGVHYGFLGAIDRVLEEVLKTFSSKKTDVMVLLTGGDAEFIASASPSSMGRFRECVVVPHLVLDGVRCVANSGGVK